MKVIRVADPRELYTASKEKRPVQVMILTPAGVFTRHDDPAQPFHIGWGVANSGKDDDSVMIIYNHWQPQLVMGLDDFIRATVRFIDGDILYMEGRAP